MENKLSHLQLIQGIVNRMAHNSFALKGWSVTLVAGILALAGKETEKAYFLVAYIPIISFWGLDAYYLQQERLYRTLYDKVRMMLEEKIDFSMAVSANDEGYSKHSFWGCFISKTEFWFYVPLALVSTCIIAVICLSH